MADISQITLPSGSTYNIKDSTARQQITELTGAVSGAIHYRGVTTTVLTDGAAGGTNGAVTIDNKSYTPSAGDVVIYGNSEFI